MQYHVHLKSGDVGEYVLLPGDPGRVPKIAAYLDEAKEVAYHREYCTWTGLLDGVKVSVTSTGIGGPSAAIAVQELARVGAHTFVRVGTCGLLQALPCDSIVVPYGVVRGGATARAYVPEQFPAVADPEIYQALLMGARHEGAQPVPGIVHCKDAFFLEETGILPAAKEAAEGWELWKRARVVATEMESDTVFILSSIYGWRAGAILLGLGEMADGSHQIKPASPAALDLLMRAAIAGVRRVIANDQAQARP
ncbi:MAG: nucleoside phosphorylase [Myxococcota bacterium]|nr:nucleoside phosphorylase [Myxococcota bacterium]